MLGYLKIAGLVAAAALVAWLAFQWSAGVQAKAEVERLIVELEKANQATLAERDLLDRRTRDLVFQIDMMSREAARRAEQEQEATEFEGRIEDFGAAVAVPPLVERTIRELFP